jgi:hypothetical protein
MAQDWEVQPPSGRCALSGRELREGEEFYTVLFEDGESFRRADYSFEAWQGPPPGAFCHFKSRVPVKQKRKRLLVDDEILISFFLRLASETEPLRLQFRFVLALILMRKRLLRYEGSQKADGVEIWRMVLTRDQSEHRVINPRLTDDQIAGVSEQLTAILHGAEITAEELGIAGVEPQEAQQHENV